MEQQQIIKEIVETGMVSQPVNIRLELTRILPNKKYDQYEGIFLVEFDGKGNARVKNDDLMSRLRGEKEFSKWNPLLTMRFGHYYRTLKLTVNRKKVYFRIDTRNEYKIESITV